MYSLKLNKDEIEVLKLAVSFLTTYTLNAAEELDLEIDVSKLDALERKLYKLKIKTNKGV